MTARYAVRPVTTDAGETLWWLIVAETGQRLLSHVDRGYLERLIDGVDARVAARAVARAEAGSW